MRKHTDNAYGDDDINFYADMEDLKEEMIITEDLYLMGQNVILYRSNEKLAKNTPSWWHQVNKNHVVFVYSLSFAICV